MARMSQLRRNGIVAALASVVLLGAFAPSGHGMAPQEPVPTVPPVETIPATGVRADALPTVQIDSGIVWDQEIVGNTVYAGGSFTQTRPADVHSGQGQLTARTNILAYDITTGDLLSFAPRVNGVVKAVEASSDGRRLYIGGAFTSVDGRQRWNIAAFDTATGALVDEFAGAVGGSYVNALAITESTVYAGGLFSQANGTARTNLAAFDHQGTLTTWAPSADLQVDSMLANPTGGSIVVAGRFGTINDTRSPGTAALDPVSGTRMPWALNQDTSGVVNGGTSRAGTMGLTTDGTSVFGAAWSMTIDSRYASTEGLWAADATTGELTWLTTGAGDHYGVHVKGETVYSVGHLHQASGYGGFPESTAPWGNHQFAQAVTSSAQGSSAKGGHWNHQGQPVPALVNWYPDFAPGKASGLGQAGWTVEGNDEYVVVGGEFPSVNGRSQQGLVRFAVAAKAPGKVGPRLAGDAWQDLSGETKTDGATIAVTPNTDVDDRELTYRLYRQGEDLPVASETFAADPWNRTRHTIRLVDRGAQPNTTYAYTVEAVDGSGNSARSNPVHVTTGPTAAQPAGAYAEGILQDEPGFYYRLGKPIGSAAMDWAGDNDGVIDDGIEAIQETAVAGADPEPRGGAVRLPGTGAAITTSTPTAPAGSSTQELWLRTTSTAGGLVMGHFGGGDTAGALTVSMLPDGRLVHSVLGDASRTVTTENAYHDGAWHHVVVTTGADGHRLFVDGVQVAATPDPVKLTQPAGQWRLGSGPQGEAPDKDPKFAGSGAFVGDLDEVAVYNRVLTTAQIDAHYQQGVAVPPATVEPTPDTGATPDGGSTGGGSTDGGSTDGDRTGGTLPGPGPADGDAPADAAVPALPHGDARAPENANRGAGSGDREAEASERGRAGQRTGHEGTGRAASLAITGVQVGGLVLCAAGLVVAGIAMRARRHHVAARRAL